MTDFRLPALGFPYSALEPFLDAETMLIHHEHHYASHIQALNRILNLHPELRGNSPQELLVHLVGVPESIREAVRNHAGGCVNHQIFFSLLRPRYEHASDGVVEAMIRANFGDFESFQLRFEEAAIKLFGSGWVWLVTADDRLRILSTHNQDSPFSLGLFPLLGIDLWEHAYHHRYRNDRAAYLRAWWQVLDWRRVNERMASAGKTIVRRQPVVSLDVASLRETLRRPANSPPAA